MKKIVFVFEGREGIYYPADHWIQWAGMGFQWAAASQAMKDRIERAMR